MKRAIIIIIIALAMFSLLNPQSMLLAQTDRVTFVPSLDYKSFLIKQAVKTSEKRERVINILTDLLKLYPDGEEKAQLKLRLAHLYLDKARHLYFLELYKNDPEADKLIKGEMTTSRQNLQKLQLETSFSFNRAAINLYRDVLNNYPKISNRDEVLFYLAYNLGEVGENRQSQNHYNTLINTYPNSKYVPEAFLVQAEYAFYDDKFQKALDTYKKVLAYKTSEVRDLAIYKMAWCYFNLSNTNMALKTMEMVAEPGVKSSAGLDLREEALRDLVIIFSYGGYHKEAPFYFKQVGGVENYRSMLKQLANLYFLQGKNGYADEMYKRLLAEDQEDKENPEFQKRLVEIAKRLGKKEDVIMEASKLVRIYSDESKWSAKNRNDWNALQQARDLSETTLRDIAMSMHNEAQKTKDDRTYQLANAAYREYLDNFPTTKDANKIRFYYAESLYKLGKVEQAGIEYSKVVNAEPKGPFALLAAYGAIVSYDAVIKNHGGIKIDKSSKKPSFIQLWERESIRVSDNFVKTFPQDKRAPQIAFKAARVFYDHNHFKEAVKRFDQIITDYPAATTTMFSINLVLDSWNIQEKWDEVVAWGKKYYANPAVPPGKFKQDLFSLIEKASFKVCRALEESGKFSDAAVAYLKFADEFKQSEFVDDAMNNAAVSYRKGKDVENAIKVYQRLIKEQPASPFIQSAVLAVGKGYEDLAMFAEAANYYELYQQRYPTTKNAPDLIYNAGVFRENLGQLDKAIQDYNIYVTKYRTEKDIAVTEFAVPLLLEKQKRWQDAANVYTQLAARYRGQGDFYITALGKGAEMFAKLNDQNRATTLYKQVLGAYNAHVGAKRPALGQESLELVAKAHFKLVEPIFIEYARVKLDVPLANFTPLLQRKIKLLDQLVKEYQRVIAYRSPLWVTTSVYRMALAYDDFAVNLKKVKEPTALAVQERQAFMQQLADIAQNMRNKASEAYGACIERAAELDVFDPIVAKAEKRLADLSAKTKTEVKEFVHDPVYIDDSVGKGELL